LAALPMTGSIAAKVLNYFAHENANKKKYNLTEREKQILGF
jgi:hypothetical protein